MPFSVWMRLQSRLQAFEAALIRRENVIRFLVGRCLLMLAMVIGFWLAIRNAI